MTTYNPVMHSNIQFWVHINETSIESDDAAGTFDVLKGGMQMYPYKLFDNESPALFAFDKDDLAAEGFDKWPETKFFDTQQVQLIQATRFSDQAWIASNEVRENLRKFGCFAYWKAVQLKPEMLNEEQYKSCNRYEEDFAQIKEVSVGFELFYDFDREVSFLFL